ncbi:hypothetical protein FRC18_003275, partial [Serendipita sp. 400]
LRPRLILEVSLAARGVETTKRSLTRSLRAHSSLGRTPLRSTSPVVRVATLSFPPTSCTTQSSYT